MAGIRSLDVRISVAFGTLFLSHALPSAPFEEGLQDMQRFIQGAGSSEVFIVGLRSDGLRDALNARLGNVLEHVGVAQWQAAGALFDSYLGQYVVPTALLLQPINVLAGLGYHIVLNSDSSDFCATLRSGCTGTLGEQWLTTYDRNVFSINPKLLSWCAAPARRARWRPLARRLRTAPPAGQAGFSAVFLASPSPRSPGRAGTTRS